MYTLLNILHIDDVYHFSWIELASNAQSGERSQPATNTVLYGKIEVDSENVNALRQHIDASVQALNLAYAANYANTPQPRSGDSTVFENLGRILFGRFIPLQIQRAIRSLPDHATIQLITNDVKLPWELLHDNRDFLAVKYQLSRTPLLDEPLSPSQTKTRRETSCLLLGNPTSDLPAADEEILAVSDILYTAQPRVTYQLLSKGQVSSTQFAEKLASNEFDLIHYAGHAYNGKLKLVDGWFSVEELGRVFDNHPIVLLHACSSGSAPTTQINSLADLSAGVESIAGAFVRAGAAAVIGMLWPIPDQSMLQFSKELYSHFAKGLSIGEALRLSRMSLRKSDSTGITWLSPVLYGTSERIVISTAAREVTGTILAVRLPDEQTMSARYTNGRASSMQDGLLTVRDLVAESGGEIVQAIGTTLCATFGVQQLQDKNTVAALESAQEIQTLAARGQINPPAIAIASGKMQTLSGSQNDDAQTNSTPILVGTPVSEVQHLLSQRAYGEVLVNQHAYDQCAMSVDAQPREIQTTNQEHIVSYSLTLNGSQTSTEYHSVELDTLVGREDELERLLAYWRTAVDGDGVAVGITGEAGVGKSQLVRKFEETISVVDDTQDKTAIQRVACTTNVQNTPYGLWARLFRRLLGITQDADSPEIAQRISVAYQNLEARNGAVTESDLLLLNDLLGSTEVAVSRPEKSVYQSKLYVMLRKLLHHEIRQHPLLLIVEDVHWADQGSLDLLNFLIDEIQDVPILLLYTSRTEERQTEFLKSSAAIRSIHLGELDNWQRLEFFRQGLELEQLPDPLKAFIESSSGNPLFLSEILISLRERWQPSSDNGFAARQVLHAVLHTLDIPDTVQRTIQMRLVKLNDEDARVLKMAAVLEQNCTKELLNIGLEADDQSLEQSLRTLTSKNFLRYSWNQDCYEFRHSLMQEVVYEQIDYAQRQLWHKRVGEFLADQQAEDNHSFLASITHHYFSSLVEELSSSTVRLNLKSEPDLVDKTLLYLVRSGRAALDLYGGAEAALFFERAKLIVEQLPQETELQGDVYSGLGDAYTFSGKIEQACSSYQVAHSSLHYQPLNYETKPLAANLARKLGRLYYMSQGDSVASQAWFETGLAYVENECSLQSRTASALLHIHRGAAFCHDGLYSKAQASCRLGLNIAQQCDDKAAAAAGHFLLGAILQSQSNYSHALESLHNALILEEALKNDYQIHRIKGNLGIIYFEMGLWSEAESNLEQARMFWKEIHEFDRFALTSMNRGLLYQHQGDWGKANEQYAQSLEIWETVINQRFKTFCHVNQASLAIEQNLWQSAREYLDVCLQRIEEFSFEGLRAYILCTYATVELAVGNIDSAKSYIEAVEKLPKEKKQPAENAGLRRLKGCLAALDAKIIDAYTYFEESYRLFDQLGNPFEKGRTKYAMAKYMSIYDKCRAIKDCNEAIHIFNELGAKADLKKAKALLDKLK